MTGEDRKHGEYLPDAYLSYDSVCRSWSDILVFAELRKGCSELDTTENVTKMTGSMARCLAMDPRRRAVFAFTIENTSMRFWYRDRSNLVVSESFSFIKTHEPLIHFILSLILATPAQHGFDPTVTAVEDGRGHAITVRSSEGSTRVYRALELLSAQDVICGKGTRVWKVVEIHDGKEAGPPRALKDCWVNPSLIPEGTIYDQILADIPLPQQPSLLQVEFHGDVYLDEGSGEFLDCTRSLDLSAHSSNASVTSRAELLSHSTEADKSCNRLVHYRIVFQDVCKSLGDETSLPVIFHALSETAIALKPLHAAGWIHRDISTSNIFVDDNGRTYLGDFEYAKTMGTQDESRAGTAYFMAIEVDAGRYLFSSVNPHNTSPIKKKYPKMVARIEKWEEQEQAAIPTYQELAARSFQKIEPVIPPFRYNPLHDMESLWWIAVYFALKKELTGDSVESPIASAEQRTLAAQLFRHRTHRQLPLIGGNFLQEVSTCLPPLSYLIVKNLRYLCHEIYTRYFVEELELQYIDKTSADGLHSVFADVFAQISSAQALQGLKVRSFTYVDDTAEDDLFDDPDPSICRFKRRRSITPSDDSIDYSQFKKAKAERDVNPQKAGVSNRTRPYLSRKVKTRAQHPRGVWLQGKFYTLPVLEV
ncbi:hypothetical protein EIP86_005588 [Pleurotus ostreatoroseus]|nr:hypothetical protein EIP86_005588 [Pleurotus ostreatoroseus]